MDQERDDWAEYMADLDAREQECERILTEAETRPLTKDEITLLRWAVGLSN